MHGLIHRARLLEADEKELLESCQLPEHRRCEGLHNLRGYRHLLIPYCGLIDDLRQVSSDLPPGLAYFVVTEQLVESGLELPQPLDRLVVQEIAVQISFALAALAAAHIVHGDIKLGNIMRRPSGFRELVLMDYGCSRLTNDGEHACIADGFPKGVILNLAPELTCERFTNTPATDMWAFGMMLHEAATGWRAWAYGPKPAGFQPQPKTLQEMASLVNGGLSPFCTSLDDYGESRFIAPIVQRCLDFDAAKRPRPAEVVNQLTVRSSMSDYGVTVV